MLRYHISTFENTAHRIVQEIYTSSVDEHKAFKEATHSEGQTILLSVRSTHSCRPREPPFSSLKKEQRVMKHMRNKILSHMAMLFWPNPTARIAHSAFPNREKN
ncbi:hypothetical protein YC2023_098690 [Brassica napus]